MKEVVGSCVSRETFERLELLVELITKWNRKINLISPGTIPDIWRRHIADSVQVANLESDHGSWADLGSGGGFPGLVVAAVNAGQGMKSEITLVESDTRKCVFLKEAAREMGLQVNVLNRRIESVRDQRFDVVSARALADLDTLLDYAFPLLNDGAKCIFMKGSSVEEEIEAARHKWRFDLTAHMSETDQQARILCLERVARAGP